MSGRSACRSARWRLTPVCSRRVLGARARRARVAAAPQPAPKLCKQEMVDNLKPGSVIVDLAAAAGGNSVVTKPDEMYVTDGGVR